MCDGLDWMDGNTQSYLRMGWDGMGWDGMDWMGWLSYTAVTPRASLLSDANKVLPTLTMGFCLSVTSLRLQRTGPSCLITVHAGLGNSILFFT